MIPYIILRDSVEQAAWEELTSEQQADPANFKGHKFRVVQGGYKPVLQRDAQVQKTIGGRLDVGMGHVHWGALYTIRLSQANTTEDDADAFGTADDLERYYKLNQPNAAPSNEITLIDHYENSHVGVLLGEYSPQPLTTMLVGETAYFFIQIQFQQLDAVS